MTLFLVLKNGLSNIMKKNLFTIFVCVCMSFFGLMSFSLAQDCDAYYPFEEGTKVELTTYNKKDKMTGKMVYLIQSVENTAEGKKATINMEMYDDKGELVEMEEGVDMNRSFDVICDGEMTRIDMGAFAFTNPAMGAYQNMEMTIEGESLDIPNNLSVGTSLPDANMRISVNTGPMNMNMTTNFTNRKVVSQENLTTSAGTFDTFAITYDHEFKMGLVRKSSAKQWISKKVGVVREEYYDKKGNLSSYMMLTGLEQ